MGIRYPCGSVAQINFVVPLAVCQLVVVNQRPQMKQKRTTITYKVCIEYVDNVDDSLLQY